MLEYLAFRGPGAGILCGSFARSGSAEMQDNARLLWMFDLITKSSVCVCVFPRDVSVEANMIILLLYRLYLNSIGTPRMCQRSTKSTAIAGNQKCRHMSQVVSKCLFES